jgi:cytochrome b subunit of formate dehydrogenase
MMAKNDKTTHAAQGYLRFPVTQRIEHVLLILSFGALGFTGLIQRYAGNQVAEALIALLGGIELVRIIHRIAAILLAAQSIYHVLSLIHKVFVQRVELTMLPGLKDVVDAIDVVRHNLGLTKEHPRLPRYNFAEKAEYWAMIWGTIVMGLTGFMLWNPIVTTRLLPGETIPAAKAAHSAEALLAVLAILVWHFYNVHIKFFNKAMFTGKMSRHQMEEEHGAELEQIEAGRLRPRPNLEAMRRRERIFLPVALFGAVIGMLGLYLFASYETTAVATVPQPPSTVPVFAPVTPSVAPSSTPKVDNASLGAAIPHPIVGQEKCDTCHGPKGIRPWPSNHDGRPNESCLICHKLGPTPTPGPTRSASQGVAGAITHALAGKEQCDTCHGGPGSLKPNPADHAGRAITTCTACHKPAGAPTAGAPAAGTPAPAAGVAKPIPHSITDAAYKDCATCHGAGKLKPNPANHASFTVESCATCHKAAATAAPAAGAATPAPAAGTPVPAVGAAKPIPHSIAAEMFKDCSFCHGADKMKPNPANHASFTVESCQTCHKPGVR